MRGVDSNFVSYVAAMDSGRFNYLDAPSSGGDYYYRVSRWENGTESPLSNAIKLTASPTAVEDKQIEKHAFLLSEPIPPKGRNWYYWRKERENEKWRRKKPF